MQSLVPRRRARKIWCLGTRLATLSRLGIKGVASPLPACHFFEQIAIVIAPLLAVGLWTIANYSTGWWALALLSLWVSVVNYVWHSYLPNSTPYLRKLCEAYRKTYLPQLDPPCISQIYYIKDSRRQAKCDLRPLSIPGYSWINNHHNNGVFLVLEALVLLRYTCSQSLSPQHTNRATLQQHPSSKGLDSSCRSLR